MQRQNRSEKKAKKSTPFVIKPDEVKVDRSNVLGRGGFGTVYRGRWGGHDVAVKLLDRGISPEILRKEVDVWQSLRHPNILEFYGYNSSDPLFLVSALKQGDAHAFLRSNPDASRPKLLYETSLGLQHLHRHSIIHGDVKALNILVDRRGTACLSDFGLSRVRELSTGSSGSNNKGGPKGSFRWMAPECMVGTILGTPMSDIYSFGMTIYEIFTGHPPFPGLTDPVIYVEVAERKKRPNRPTDQEIESCGLDESTQLIWSIVSKCWRSCMQSAKLFHWHNGTHAHPGVPPHTPTPGMLLDRQVRVVPIGDHQSTPGEAPRNLLLGRLFVRTRTQVIQSSLYMLRKQIRSRP
ncbi:hypothetical protein JAAARDRAFT_63418 [Jaapia argillacea MUCL 33604]|uniref:Protein kinase domain-containing protein n=1 Tax=Jaapia argillacea MUCL 33604 TaxID=933084 RepID=A0A067PHT7_9AGAM|nr:hypothetical protein JAAARDRAFT_63418 [Jaapia argillacea MUCL 33604]